MQEREHDALPLPGSSTANALSGNPFLVAATLTAIFLAGSAMVYRNRPQLGYNSSGREQAPSRRVLVVSANVDGKEAVHGGLEEKPAGSRDADNAAKPANDFEQKEGKTARSKDRRRRGKDPLKEILKSGKKLKGFDTSTVSSPKPTPTKPTHAQRVSVDEADEVGSPSPSTSALPSESIAITETLHGSLSRNVGKRTQRENSRASNGDATLPSAGSTSAGHSRGTSEVSQSRRQESSVELLSPSQSHSVLSSHSSHEHHRSQPTCDRPQSPAASVSEDGGRVERSRSRGRARRPALEEGGETSERESLAIGRAHEARLAGDQRETASTIPSPAMAYNNSSSNSSCAGSMTTAASLSMTPATSPTLSQTSSLSKSAPSLAQPTSDANQNSANPDFTQHQKLNPGLSSPSPIPSNSQSSRNIRSTSKSTTNDSLPSSSSIDTPHTLTATGSTPTASGLDSPMKTKNGSRKASTQLGATHSSVANNGKAKSNQAPSPWDWDGAAVDVAAPESSSSSTTSPVMPVKTNEKEKESYKKPPRLQGKASANSTYSSFSAVAAAGTMTASTTHPASLHSPTSASFGSTMTASVSANPGGVSRGRSPPPSEEEAGVEDKDKETDEPFIYPTLNPPPTSVSGPSRLRSSFAEGGGNGIPSTPSRRTRPPSRTGSTSTPPPGSASSSVPQRGNSVTSDGSSSVLSTQTQLASLRGALEAARLREEKNKADTERYLKELETLRWETANSRRGEAELQAQVRSLTYQLQSLYASAVNAQILQQQQQQQPRQQTGGAANGNGTGEGGDAGSGNESSASTSSAPIGHSAGSSSSSGSGTTSTPHQPPSSTSTSNAALSQVPTVPTAPPKTPGQQPLPAPLHLHMLSGMQMNGIAPASGSFSGVPSPMVPPLPGLVAPSPFLPYVLPPPPPHAFFTQHLQNMQQYQQQSPTLAHAQPNLFSPMLFPPQVPPTGMMSPPQQHPSFGYGFGYPPQHSTTATASNTNLAGGIHRSGPSSVAGTSSTGSGSPELNGSPSLNVGKKKRIRTRNRAVNGRMPVWEEGSGADGWIGGVEKEEGTAVDDVAVDEAPAEGGGGEDDDDAHSEGGFNELLADAILKRPGSIRVRSSSRKGKLSSSTASLEKDGKEEPVDQEKVDEVMEQLAEFTFPSISDLGNVYYRSGSRAGTEENSLSSSLPSLPSSPPVTSSVPHDVVVALETEEDRNHLPPVVEAAGQIHAFSDVKILEQHFKEPDIEPTTIYATSPAGPQSSSYPDSETTLRKEDLELASQDSSTTSSSTAPDQQDRGLAVQREQEAGVPFMQ